MSTEQEMITRVGHIKYDADCQPGPDDLYIGRAMPRYGLRASPFANPYRVGMHGDRQECLALFRRYFRENRPDLHVRLGELRGKTLLCWCHTAGGAGEECHGDWLAWIADDPARLWQEWEGWAR